LCLAGATLSFNVAACAALVPSIAQEFGVSHFLAGKIVWVYMLSYGVAALIYGPLVKFFDAKRIELICFLLFCLANLLAASAKNIGVLLGARFLMGIFGASVIPLVLILVARNAKEKNRGRLVGIFFSATFAASLAGLFLSGIISWRLIFLIPGIFGILLWIHMYYYLPSFKAICGGSSVNYWGALRSKAISSLFAYIFLISFIYHGVQQWLGVYFAQRYGFGQFIISMLVTVTSLSGIFGEVLGGFFADTWGRKRIVNIGIALMIISVFLLVLKLPLWVLFFLMIVWGLGWTFNHSGLSTKLTDLPGEFLNEAASLNSSVRFLSGGIGAALAGVVLQKSFTLGFLVLGVGLVVLFIGTLVRQPA